ncbi:MAG: hypothetical protein O7A62_10620 [Alphaproteobacteria bacterium]|nr:hypothetical protein [Alphaproteobacteria bacterium]
MALNIDTFSNTKGGFPFFKAVGHPAAAPKAHALLARLGESGPLAIYDPTGFATAFFEIYPPTALDITHVYGQDLSALGQQVLGRATQPVTDLASADVASLLVVAFDADKIVRDIAHLIPPQTEILTLDEVRLDKNRLTNPHRYLDPFNFATNFAWFRDAPDGRGGRLHTRVATANYWHRFGARDVTLWLTLFDETGAPIAEWDQPLPNAPAGITIDSAEVRQRFGLGDFTGQLLIHAIGVAGHDIVKYALDTFGDDPKDLSCTHDANAWPADFYAGLPAPQAGERVVLWIQNSHPCPIPAGAVGLNLMGDGAGAVWLDQAIPPFATHALDVAKLLPDAEWPQQLEVRAGKHFVRPRYEIERKTGDGTARRRMAHVNVERTDLEPDPQIAEIGNMMGKGFLLPAPVLPPERYRSILLPTPMSTTQETLPVAALIYDGQGREVARHDFGELARGDSVALDADQIGAKLNGDAGHMELVYDFPVASRGVDGWLHALFRYEDRVTGHAAESSFGAHIFNTVLTWKDEPQSYTGHPPGLSTRLFLRTAPGMAVRGTTVSGAASTGTDPLSGADTFCHLIYPASTPWRGTSQTDLILHAGDGSEVATRTVNILCGGSLYWLLSEMFDGSERARAAENGPTGGGYVLIRDTTCRLFGYHGLIAADGAAFSLDHMFGF